MLRRLRGRRGLALLRRLGGRLGRPLLRCAGARALRRLAGGWTLAGALLLGRRRLRHHQGGGERLDARETGQDGARQEQPLELVHAYPRLLWKAAWSESSRFGVG
ncbi:hypothetical protein J2S22_003606 [Rhodoplanes tepidamans]|uniref:Uncharacterized protein n=1 Tax=Rhodoplanes tepidamans TaxID=200616 RepID=A0ABT5JFB9_RHOTP|nr:hypothetical protein [Rhodoplanes tepidamans]MDC7787745.1 hypothetical protein [Rhodoplanes tepidamans]MDQ0356667.1 hypothetical protein [Rhodoplanes tepidamans]